MDLFGLLFCLVIVIVQGCLTYLAWFRIEKLFELQRKHMLLIDLVEWFQRQKWYPGFLRISNLLFLIIIAFVYFFLILPAFFS